MQDNNNAHPSTGLPETIDTEEDLLRALRYLERRIDGLEGRLDTTDFLAKREREDQADQIQRFARALTRGQRPF